MSFFFKVYLSLRNVKRCDSWKHTDECEKLIVIVIMLSKEQGVNQREQGWQTQPLIEEELGTVKQLRLMFNDRLQRTASQRSMILADSMCFSWVKTPKPEDMKLQTEVSLFFPPSESKK